jgi:hypothetical protein
MYAGGTDPDKVVIHSTWKSSGNGPQFADIAEFKRGEKLRAVIRPGIFSVLPCLRVKKSAKPQQMAQSPIHSRTKR